MLQLEETGHQSHFFSKVILIKPRRMHEGCSSCVCVCYHASGYIPGLYVQSEAAYGFS